MLKHILNALDLVEYGENELIDIAKGKYKKATTWNELKRDVKEIFKK
jgi:hypothetical protein